VIWCAAAAAIAFSLSDHHLKMMNGWFCSLDKLWSFLFQSAISIKIPKADAIIDCLSHLLFNAGWDEDDEEDSGDDDEHQFSEDDDEEYEDDGGDDDDDDEYQEEEEEESD